MTKRLDRLHPAGRTGTRDERGCEDDSMDQHRREEPLDVLGDHEATAVEQSPRPGRTLEREATPHGAPDDDRLLFARCTHQLDHPSMQDGVDVYVLCGCAQFVHLVQTDDRAKIVERVHVALIGEDLQLVGELRISERRAEEEAVELRLR